MNTPMKDIEKIVHDIVAVARKRRNLRAEDALYLLTIPHRTEEDLVFLEALKPLLQTRYNITVVEFVRDSAERPMTIMLQVSKK